MSRATTNAEDMNMDRTSMHKKDKDDLEDEITPGGQNTTLEQTPAKSGPSDKPEPKQIMFIKVKKETTAANLAALLVIPSISVAASAYVNANMPYLLQSPDHFNIPFSETGRSAGRVLFWAMLAATILTPFLGYLYDLFSRKWIIIPMFFVVAAIISVLPYSAPLFWRLAVFRGLLVISSRLIHVNPLVIDYVKSESRGLGIALASLGLVFGEIIMVSMFAATRKLSMAAQYWVPAIVISILTLTLIFLIREPTVKRKEDEVAAVPEAAEVEAVQEEAAAKKKSLLQRSGNLT